MPAFLTPDTPLAFAHRGGGGERPENTMAAFDHAVGLGYAFVETDIQATADGVCVLLHDPTPPAVRGLTAPVASLRWTDLTRVTVDGEPVPRVEELFDAWPQLRVNLDVKTDAAVGPLIALLRRRPMFDRICVGSFSDRRLAQVRAAFGTSVTTSMGPRDVTRLRLAASRALPRRAVPRHARCVQVPVRHGRVRVVDPAFVRTAHALGLQVHVWTVNEPDEMRRLLDLGVDGLMTDEVSILRGVLVDRGEWPDPPNLRRA